MAEPFIGEIRIFAGNYAPRGWAFCEGQLLAVSQHDALFSLLGTIYGGDGETTFGLPDMRGRVPVHYGNGPDLSDYQIGAKGGQESITLTVNQIPVHTHSLRATNDPATERDPGGRVPGMTAQPTYSSGAADLVADTGLAGGSQFHSNIQPFQCLYFIIALVGIYTSET